MATDDFNRVENPLSTGWTLGGEFTTGLKADGANALGINGSDDNVSVRTGTYPNDQFSEVVLGTVADNGGPVVRGSASVSVGYALSLDV